MRLNAASDSAAQVSFADTRTLLGRAGARLIKTWDTGDADKPRPLSAWLGANVVRQFLNEAATTFADLAGGNGVSFAAPLAGTFARVSVGVTGSLDSDTHLFLSGTYQNSVDGQQDMPGAAASALPSAGEVPGSASTRYESRRCLIKA